MKSIAKGNPMKETENFHGSDIEKVAAYYKIDKESIHNYSGNVNPMGLSSNLEKKLIQNIHLVTSYPDPDYAGLKDSIAKYVKSSKEYVLLGNGTTELIAHYIDYVKPKVGLVIGPTYSEYEKKMTTLNTEVRYYPLEEINNFEIDVNKLIDALWDENLGKKADLLVLCNPNNPTATLSDYKQLYPVFDLCKSLGIHILIDETYMDFVEDWESISAINLVKTYSNLIVLRGFSKFFAAPGLRLGYGITSDINCHRFISKQRHHWAINSLAAFAGEQLMRDEDFINASSKYINTERIRVTNRLNKLPSVKVYPTASNFFFIKLVDSVHTAKDMFEYLIKKGMMIRNTTSFPFIHGEFIRFCLLTQEENDALIDAMNDYLNAD